MRLALAQFDVAERPAGLEDFLGRIARLAGAAKAGGADLLVLPEYAAMVLAGAFVKAPDLSAELRAVTSRAAALLEGLQATARDAGLWLLGGTLPMRDDDGRVRNRAPFIAPSGACRFQDKQAMTRFEAEQWGISGGAGPSVFETPFGRIGVSICYDVEFPLHVRAQVAAGAVLILVPSCTEALAGFTRVHISARARAIENQCVVAMAPLVGLARWSGAIDENHGFAGLFGPADHGFPADGVIGRGEMDVPELVFATVDLDDVAKVRRGGGVLNHRDWPALPLPCPVQRFS